MGGGGGGGSTSTRTTEQNTSVTVTNNISGPPINVNVGSEVLSPIANTFAPVASGLQNSLQALTAGFQDAEVRRQREQGQTAELIAMNAQQQKLVLYAVLGLAGLLLIRR